MFVVQTTHLMEVLVHKNLGMWRNFPRDEKLAINWSILSLNFNIAISWKHQN